MSVCPNHSDKGIFWVCLEKQCDLRVMCNVCAVKTHDKSHKVDELEKLQK